MRAWICLALLFCTSASAQTRIACGRSQPYTDVLGQVWAADPLTTGNIFTTSHAINIPQDGALYQDERWGTTLTYKFSVPNGKYNVRLLLDENYWTKPGQRVMSFTLQGQVLYSAIDIFAEVGQFTPDAKTGVATVTDGTLTIVLAATVDNAKCSAIEILPVAPPPMQVTVPGLGTVSFPIANANMVPACTAADGPTCTIVGQWVDANGAVVTSSKGTLNLVKTVNGQSTTFPVAAVNQ